MKLCRGEPSLIKLGLLLEWSLYNIDHSLPLRLMFAHGTCLRRYRLHPNDLHRSAPAQRTAADEEKASRRASYEACPNLNEIE
jgi:hypothetical protein